ncbi:MAG: MMPL family transporter [Desulfobacteraceae bacterium]|nr:MMPL family transporter [Desulfobacteraceae bacterium]
MQFPLHTIILRHHRLILWMAALLTLTAIGLCTRLSLDLNFLSLLPPRNAHVKAFLNVSEKTGLQSFLIAVVEPHKQIPEKQTQEFIDLLAEQFQKSPLIEAVECKQTQTDLMNFYPLLLQHLPRLLSPKSLKRLPEIFSDAAIQNKVAANRKLLSTPFGFATKQIVLTDPLALGELLQDSLSLPSTTTAQNMDQGYYRSNTGVYFLFIKPKKPPQDIAFSKQLMKEAQAIRKKVSGKAGQHVRDSMLPFYVNYTGGYAIAVQDESVTRKDIQVTIISSIIGVLALFGICFRTVRVLVIVAVPLILSLIWTLGLAGLIFGRLNILTCIFSCVLAGLGIDFAIHLINRYFSPEKKDFKVKMRLETTLRETAGGIIIGALTTCTAFYTIGFSDFKGFRELGILTGSGLLLCLAAMLLVLPSILVYRHNRPKQPVIAGFGLLPVMQSAAKRPYLFLCITGCFIGLFFILGFSVKFDDNLKNFRPSDSKAILLQDKVAQWMGGSSAASLLILSGEDEQIVMNRAAGLWDILSGLESDGIIGNVAGLPQFLPAPVQQQENMNFIQSRSADFDWQRIRSTFKKALVKNGFEPLTAYDDYFTSLQKAFSSTTFFLPSQLRSTGIWRFLNMFVYTTREKTNIVLHIRPPKDLWTRQDVGIFKQRLEIHLENEGFSPDDYILTGAQLLSGELKSIILKNLRTALTLAIIAILSILYIHYRNVLVLLICLLPLATALSMLAGAMAVLKIHFSFINVIVLPMIAGIGIDDGVHLANTFVASGYRFKPQHLARTGRGVVLTSLTTMVGFGSISLSHYPGLKSLGYVALIGVGACLLTSLFILPPVMALVSRKKSKKLEAWLQNRL